MDSGDRARAIGVSRDVALTKRGNGDARMPMGMWSEGDGGGMDISQVKYDRKTRREGEKQSRLVMSKESIDVWYRSDE